ncbi:MAG: dicarboxylate transporter, DctP subunit, partial [Ramlibacter sp.]|nr:dicarboxylate transporter, DctP subunit [Ramlibacter sp.]
MKWTVTPWIAAAAATLALGLPAQAQVGTHSFRAATTDPDASAGPTGLRKFAEILEKKSGGKMKMRVYASSMLGNDAQIIASVQGGTVDFGLHGSPTLVGTAKEYGILDFPFAIRNEREADALFDGPQGKALLGKLAAKNMIGLGLWEIGFRHITNSKHPIEKWEDMAGLKMRVVASPVFLDYFNGLGANAVPMPIAEVYSALETKAIDAQDNPIGNISTMKFNEVQKYMSLVGYVYTTYTLTAAKKTWDALNEDERKLVVEAADEAKVYERQVARDLNSRLLADLKKSMQV